MRIKNNKLVISLFVGSVALTSTHLNAAQVSAGYYGQGTTWVEKNCGGSQNGGYASGVSISHDGPTIKAIAVKCTGGDVITSDANAGRNNIRWTTLYGDDRGRTTVTGERVPTNVNPPLTINEYSCPANSFIVGVGANYLGGSNRIVGLSFICASFTKNQNGTWSATGSRTSLSTIGAPSNARECGSANAAKSVAIGTYNGIPSGIRLTCDSPTRGRQAATPEDLITQRIAPIESPVLSPVTNNSYVSNGPVVFVLPANVPGASKWKVQFSTLDGRIRTAAQETRAVSEINRRLYVGPFDLDQRLRGKQVVYDFFACTRDNRCTRPNRGGLYACSKPPIGEGCGLGMISGGGGSGGGTTPPANTLSFARDLYPVITTGCAGCHSGNNRYPQKMQTNAAQCGVTSVPAIPFTTRMSAAEMLRRLKCLKASSTEGTYQRALGKTYVVPGNYNNSGLHWKAQASPAFSPEERTLIRNWIAQGANP